EELTYNYALEQFEYAAPFWCRCGSIDCLGYIKGFAALGSDQKLRLLPHASPFVRAKYFKTMNAEAATKTTLGQHSIVDFWGCDREILDDEAALTALLEQAAELAGATVISSNSHKFEYQGATAVTILAESHLSIHTWPEAGYAAVDFYTCGDTEAKVAHDMIEKALGAEKSFARAFLRGDRSAEIESVSEPSTGLCCGLNAEKNWFVEGAIPGSREGNIGHGFAVTEVLLEERSAFQEYLVFDSPLFGRVLVLDGVIQLSTSDEHIYHEMLVHPPMLANDNPKRVLVIGGGDGGTLREILKHDPEEVVMIDIDEQFVRSIAKHLPTLHNGSFEDPRLKLLFEDANVAIDRYKDYFDVAIIDCNDALGPSEPLFEESFYSRISTSLKSGGTCSVQAGSLLDGKFLGRIKDMLSKHIGATTGFRFTIPIYHCGEYVFFVASKQTDPGGPDQARLAELQASRGLKTQYWSPAIHHATQVLPLGMDLW
ncbi:MAG: adenosylmethionine decarboxylase, partial [Verrucomicrobiales bacterium]|nr:adenosylmethionine decarboxylase [Verrucomicrobiales bacterium]